MSSSVVKLCDAATGGRKAGLEALQDVAVDSPAHAVVVVALVVQGEAGFLKRRQITADRPGRDARGKGQLPGRRREVDTRGRRDPLGLVMNAARPVVSASRDRERHRTRSRVPLADGGVADRDARVAVVGCRESLRVRGPGRHAHDEREQRQPDHGEKVPNLGLVR